VAATPPEMNRLAAAVQFWAEPELLFGVPRASFDPAPEVDSAVIILKTKTTRIDLDSASKKETAERYYATVRSLFQQPRKTIANNLMKSTVTSRLTKEKIREVLEQTGVDPSGRPQDLTVQKIRELARVL
jgi:16S rRNA (adenine1518-N6/adenine1519-N6)-dimethyltransferase